MKLSKCFFTLSICLLSQAYAAPGNHSNGFCVPLGRPLIMAEAVVLLSNTMINELHSVPNNHDFFDSIHGAKEVRGFNWAGSSYLTRLAGESHLDLAVYFPNDHFKKLEAVLVQCKGEPTMLARSPVKFDLGSKILGTYDLVVQFSKDSQVFRDVLEITSAISTPELDPGSYRLDGFFESPGNFRAPVTGRIRKCAMNSCFDVQFEVDEGSGPLRVFVSVISNGTPSGLRCTLSTSGNEKSDVARACEITKR